MRLPDGCDQRTVMQAMLDAGHRHPPRHHVRPPRAGLSGETLRHPLPHSEAAQDRCILLPLYPQMTDQDQETVVAALRAACAH